MVVAASYTLDLTRSVDGLRLRGNDRSDGLARYWRLDLNLYRRNSRKRGAATETESCVVGVRFTARLAQRH